ncbi:hypothetical protein KFZ70_04290 [Tamlana fucoidanivorans]|uniref:Uncharacterized protein n=1 Tax=Allotamlana fucoidanivorans TaxID=2583814 RepID=A0A5C4SSY7_9FLAO|nr:hypothetical protein [Tamlana fucoidanivorans]TNJ47258.1 hypothetical protein FGF67_01685 [Tamlana fucoidanivorans]
MNRTPIILIAFLSFTLLAYKCDDNQETLTQETAQVELNKLKSEIETLAASSVCGESYTCHYIGLGSKPCGGFWSYITYSTSIDTEKLKKLVESYNENEKAFNSKWEVMSDCAMVNPPTSLKCENNKCIAEY